MEEGIYLFCMAQSGLLPALSGTGVDGQYPLFQHPFQNITAVLSRISLKDFCGPAAETKMQDLSWMGPRALRHQEVVQEVMGHSAVLPARFGTLFSSIETLERSLEKQYEAIRQFLDQVADKAEWAVKGLIDKKKISEDLLSALLAKEEGQLSSLPPGKRYFQEQRLRGSLEKELNRWVKEVSQKVAKELSQYASDFCERKVLSRAATGDDWDMVFNWAFLVPQKAQADFSTRIDQANAEFAKEGLVIMLSGPWPPYSFCQPFETELRE